jgi:hypothetical protein
MLTGTQNLLLSRHDAISMQKTHSIHGFSCIETRQKKEENEMSDAAATKIICREAVSHAWMDQQIDRWAAATQSKDPPAVRRRIGRSAGHVAGDTDRQMHNARLTHGWTEDG